MTALLKLIAEKTSGNSLCIAACSATVSAKTGEYLAPLLDIANQSNGAEFIKIDEHEILRDRIEHWAIFSESRRKTQTLSSLLAAARPKKALVFTSRTWDAGKIVSVLQYSHRRIVQQYG
jgi:superfamily II DNA/RNA helicase